MNYKRKTFLKKGLRVFIPCVVMFDDITGREIIALDVMGNLCYVNNR